MLEGNYLSTGVVSFHHQGRNVNDATNDTHPNLQVTTLSLLISKKGDFLITPLLHFVQHHSSHHGCHAQQRQCSHYNTNCYLGGRGHAILVRQEPDVGFVNVNYRKRQELYNPFLQLL